MQTIQRQALDWVREILVANNWTGSDLARKAGLTPSTVLRALNDKNHRFVFALRTLEKISRAANVPLPVALLRPEREHVNRGQSETSGVRVKYVSAFPADRQSNASASNVYVHQLPQFADDPTIFAFYNPDRNLAPWFPPGALMYGTKRRDPAVGDLVLLTRRDGRSIVVVINETDDSGLSFQRSATNSAVEFLSFSDVADLSLVIGILRN